MWRENMLEKKVQREETKAAQVQEGAGGTGADGPRVTREVDIGELSIRNSFVVPGFQSEGLIFEGLPHSPLQVTLLMSLRGRWQDLRGHRTAKPRAQTSGWAHGECHR